MAVDASLWHIRVLGFRAGAVDIAGCEEDGFIYGMNLLVMVETSVLSECLLFVLAKK